MLLPPHKTHTPGPWKAARASNRENDENHWLVTADSPHVDGGIQTVASINGPWKAGNYAANARLIAAAPELLAALQAILARVDRPGGTIASIRGEDIAQARSAIAKAQA